MQISGLVARTELNGEIGLVLGLNEANGRVTVRLPNENIVEVESSQVKVQEVSDRVQYKCKRCGLVKKGHVCLAPSRLTASERKRSRAEFEERVQYEAEKMHQAWVQQIASGGMRVWLLVKSVAQCGVVPRSDNPHQ